MEQIETRGEAMEQIETRSEAMEQIETRSEAMEQIETRGEAMEQIETRNPTTSRNRVVLVPTGPARRGKGAHDGPRGTWCVTGAHRPSH
jgi:hypothetical protein